MARMMSMEHINYVEALQSQFGTALTDATLQAAIASIGTAAKTLVLTFAQDGVWHINNNLTIPANILLWIPAGVTVNRASGVTLTLQGPLVSYNPNWQTGSGTTVRSLAAGVYTEFSRLVTTSGYVAPTDGLAFVAGSSGSSQISIWNRFPASFNTSAGNCAIQYAQPPAAFGNVWETGINTVSQWYVAHNQEAARILVDQGGIALSNGSITGTPTHVLQMTQDDAFKATGLWSVPSDARLKTVRRVANEGLASLKALPAAVWFVWNGQAGTDATAPEQIGWIAQEAAPSAPYFFTTYEDKLDPTDAAPTTLYSANYSGLPFLLVNAVKELAAQVEALTARIAALEGTAPKVLT